MKKQLSMVGIVLALVVTSCRKDAIAPESNLPAPDQHQVVVDRAGTKYNLGLTYTTTPSAPNWTPASSNTSSTCGAFTGNTIRVKVNSIDGDVVWITVGKMNGTAFTNGGTVYVKLNGVCGTLAKLESHNQTYTGNFSANVTSITVPFVMVPGVSQVHVTITSSGGAGRYHCAPITFVASGWMKNGETQVQKNILSSARSKVGLSPGQSTTSTNMWLTDMTDNDGIKWRNAINDYHAWKLAPGNVTLSSIKATMRSRLTSYVPADQALIVDRIVAIYKAPVPTNDDLTLIWMGVRQQCMEFVGKTSLNNQGVYKAYNSPGISDKKLWRPGMAVYKGSTHAMILSEIEWANNAPLNNLKVVEANYVNPVLFNNPKGQIPWSRTVGTRPLTFSSSYYSVVNLDF